MVARHPEPPVCIKSYKRLIAVVFHAGDEPMIIFAFNSLGYVPPVAKEIVVNGLPKE